jgi:hypothetical protein
MLRSNIGIFPRMVSFLGLTTYIALLVFAVVESPSTLIIGVVTLIASALYHIATKRSRIEPGES